MQDIYTNYLLTQNDKACATHLSALLNNIISHDQVTRFLNNKLYTSKDLWQYIKKKVLLDSKNNQGILIFDDTISEKPYSKENEINCWHFDHAKGGFQKGINILTCYYRSNNLQLPIAYEIIKKDKYYHDPKTGRLKRKATITKNEHFKNYLDKCIENKVDFEYVLADSWYGSKANMNYISEKLKKKFVIGVKSNRLFKMYDKSSKSWTNYSQLRHTELKSDRSYLIKLKGCNSLLTLLKKVFKNGDGSVGTLYIVSNDLELGSEALYDLYKKRWSIEVYHKNIKNHASLSKSPTKTVKTQSNHIFMSMIAYCKFEILKNKSSYGNQHQLKELLLIKANQATMKELIKLQKQFGVAA